MSAVRAKFYVNSVTKSKWGPGGEELHTVKLSPVTGGSEENKEFWKWTPAGSIELGTINAAVGEKLELGKEYYVDLTPAT